jgi:hypothetical protein
MDEDSFGLPDAKVFANIDVEHCGRSPPSFFREWTKTRLPHPIQKFWQALGLNFLSDWLDASCSICFWGK